MYHYYTKNVAHLPNLLLFLIIMLSSHPSLANRKHAATTTITNAYLQSNDTSNEMIDKQEDRGIIIKEVRRLHGSACPYAAAWLAHVSLHYKVKYYLHSTKMEQATFFIGDKATLKFQFSDPDAYYVHHLSKFEHVIHKSQGLHVAREKTLLLSTTAFLQECENNTNYSNDDSTLVIIPFYGGLPPDTDSSGKVHSLGQGNSLMDPGVKILQTMATLCSTFRYFGQAVIAVSQESDRILVEDILNTMHASIIERVRVIQFDMARPANTPFTVLAWSQDYIKQFNCEYFYKHPRDCQQQSGSSIRHEGKPINVTYFKDVNRTTTVPITYVYYTESDQILRFYNKFMLAAITVASNSSTMFFGRRREKLDQDPVKYMDNLDSGRTCGVTGFSLDWPNKKFVMPL